MSSVKNTGNPAAIAALAKGDFVNALVASTPGGIERSEKAGQVALVNSTRIPKEMSPDRETFEVIGFRFGEPYDDLFLDAELPPGWSRETTDHSMHSNILDERGRRRVSVFYKAAFYDRRADCYLLQRYQVDSYHEVSPGICAVRVLDAGAVLQQFGEYKQYDYDAAEPLEKAAHAWLKQNRPNVDDLLASWAD